MTGFTKLFSSIVASTIWREPMHVKVVWVTMLALADRNGEVSASIPGLADLSRVSVEQCRDAIKCLSSPDPDSRTKEHEGRRIEPCDVGFRLLNYLKYRELRSADERRLAVRQAVAKHRAKKSKALTVIKSNHGKHKAEADAEAEKPLRSRAPKTSETPGSERRRTEVQGMASIKAAIDAAMPREASRG